MKNALRNRNILFYLVIMALSFVMAAGFGDCSGIKKVTPCKVVIANPVNGTVLPTGTSTVVVRGHVENGLNSAGKEMKPLLLTCVETGDQISFYPESGNFSYEAALEAGKKMQTLTLEVTGNAINSGLVSNKERVTVFVGDSLVPGTPGVVDNAAAASISENLIDDAAAVACNTVNKYKHDMIYGYDFPVYGSGDPDSPFAGFGPILYQGFEIGPFPVVGSLRVDPYFRPGSIDQGLVTLGKVVLNLDVKKGNQISASLSIEPEEKVNPRGTGAKALWIQGQHYAGEKFEAHIAFYADRIAVNNVNVSWIEKNGMLTAVIDCKKAKIDLVNAKGEYGKKPWPFEGPFKMPSWAFDALEGFAETLVIPFIKIEVPVIDMNTFKIGQNYDNLNINVWPMYAGVVNTTDDMLNAALGLSVSLVEGTTPLIQGLNSFYATKGDVLPEFKVEGRENVQIAVSDDALNNALFEVVQSGLIKDLDITEALGSVLSDMGLPVGENFKAVANLSTPIIADFSVAPSQIAGQFNAGKVMARNFVIELWDMVDMGDSTKFSVDTDLCLVVLFDDTTKTLGLATDIVNSDTRAMTCYSNLVNPAFISAGKEVTNELIDELLRSLVSIEAPTFEIFGNTISASVVDVKCVNNYLTAKVGVSAE